MRLSFLLVATLASRIYAHPVEEVSLREEQLSEGGKYPPLSPELIDRCHNAGNCEVYQTARGDILRFKRGMEPGTESFNKTFADELSVSSEEPLPNQNWTLSADKRQDGSQSQLSAGSWRTDFGALNPFDAYKQIWSLCQERSCYTGRSQVATSFLKGAAWTSVNLDLYANGEYPGWDARNKFADAIMTACQKNQNWWQTRYCLPDRISVCTESKWVCNAPNYYSVSKWGPGGEFGAG